MVSCIIKKRVNITIEAVSNIFTETIYDQQNRPSENTIKIIIEKFQYSSIEENNNNIIIVHSSH